MASDKKYGAVNIARSGAERAEIISISPADSCVEVNLSNGSRIDISYDAADAVIYEINIKRRMDLIREEYTVGNGILDGPEDPSGATPEYPSILGEKGLGLLRRIAERSIELEDAAYPDPDNNMRFWDCIREAIRETITDN